MAPSSVFFILEMDHLKTHTERHAAHFNQLITSQVEKSGFDVQAISAALRQEMEPSGIAVFRLSGTEDRELLQLGPAHRPLLAITVVSAFPSTAAPMRELRVVADDRPLLYRAGRVFGIHLLVAALLGLAIYRMGVRSLHRAIEEVKTVEAELIHSEKLSGLGEIYAGLTHEINNPLSIILSKIDLLLRSVGERQLPAELLPDLEMIHRHGNRIAEIIRGLLAFARKTAFALSETDLNQVVNETVSLVEKPFSTHRIGIERHLADNLPRILASPAHLQQVLVNLLNNARDAMPQGGTIKLRTYCQDRCVVADVEDSGTGIAEDIRERIFEPFFTTKAVGKGTGLGLSVGYGIVRAHGGDIKVESLPKRGALFRIFLPIDGKAP